MRLHRAIAASAPCEKRREGNFAVFEFEKIKLLSELERLNQCGIALGFSSSQISQKSLTLADHAIEALLGMVIFFMSREMLIELIDLGRKKSDLNFGAAGVGCRACELLYDDCFFFS
jgi:hypothetical protein